jgi:two-component system, OmpR family, phosphate regulon response regulator PhoB
MAASILVVEDELAIQELLQVNLQYAGHEVLCVGDAERAQSLIKSALPDLLLIDWMLPGMPGISLARQLRQDARTRDIAIIMLTGRAEEQDRIAGLEAGADDYVTKPFSPREVLARIQSVLRRRAPQTTYDAVEVRGLRLEATTRRVFASNRLLEVGATEFRLLHFFMTHPERVHSRAQVLDQVWGDHVFVEERTVDVHIRRLRKSLEETGHHRLIETVRGSGYRFAGGTE